MIKLSYPIEKFVDAFKQKLADTPDPINALEQTIHSLGAEYLLQVNEVVLTGFPLGSATVSGKYRDKVFATLHGETHIRKLTIPKDPKTEKQIVQRTKFGDIAKSWTTLPQEVKDEYNRQAEEKKLGGKQMSGFNLYMQTQCGK